MAIKVKYFYNPAYTAVEWEARNPLLKKGQIGFELDAFTGLVTKMKVGDGVTLWAGDGIGDPLPYLGVEDYPYDDIVTNEIGDVKVGDVLQGESIPDIIRKMVSPYIEPVMISASNNADGSLKVTAVLEVGQSVDTSVDVSYLVSAVENLAAGGNIFISAAGIFTNEGYQVHTGLPLEMLLASSLNPSTAITYVISLFAKNSGGGTSNVVLTNIAFYGTVIWGYDLDPDLFPLEQTYNNPFPAENRRAAPSYESSYSFVGNGYAYMLIPSMMSPSNVFFAEVSNPVQPSNYSMIYVGSRTINNGTGTYTYEIWRSEFNIISTTKMQVT